ncbi:MAG: stage II sporulation protein M [Gemmatimonadaceae bacterium]
MTDPTRARLTPALLQVVDVETPEQVVFSYTLAGVGSRAAAAALDYLILSGVLAALYLLLAIGGGALVARRLVSEEAGGWLYAVLSLALFAIQWGYFVFFEAFADGQTPGKRQLGLRVVQDGGYSVSLAASAVRNLIRILDMQPAVFYGVGIVSAGISRSGKRLGDLVAGTVVVRERSTAVAPALGMAPAAGAPAATARLSNAEYELLDRFVARRQALDADRRRALTEQLAVRFGTRLGDEQGQPLARLIRLHGEEQAARARGASARGDTGAAREQHLIVARGAPRWSEFAKLLDDVRKRGLHALSEGEVGAFVAQYRELSGDLARLRTASRGREPESLYFLSRLVAGGHNLLYRRRRIAGRVAQRYLLVAVPREIRRSWRPILLCVVFLFAPLAISSTFVARHPERARELVSAGMIDRAEQGVVRARQGKGYIPVSAADRPALASRVMTNNVQVTFGVFAAGLTAGVLTLLMLVYNGVAIGSVLGLYASKGIAREILTFGVAHSVFELSAICIAAAGGLLIGSAFVLPGAHTRREALVLRGRRAIRLLTAAILFLVVAGSIEGLISPRDDWPLAWKGAVAGMSALVMALYIASARGGGEDMAESYESYAYGEGHVTARRVPSPRGSG